MGDTANTLFKAVEAFGPTIAMLIALAAVNGFYIWRDYKREERWIVKEDAMRAEWAEEKKELEAKWALEKDEFVDKVKSLENEINGKYLPLYIEIKSLVGFSNQVIERNTRILEKLI